MSRGPGHLKTASGIDKSFLSQCMLILKNLFGPVSISWHGNYTDWPLFKIGFNACHCSLGAYMKQQPTLMLATYMLKIASYPDPNLVFFSHFSHFNPRVHPLPAKTTCMCFSYIFHVCEFQIICFIAAKIWPQKIQISQIHLNSFYCVFANWETFVMHM